MNIGKNLALFAALSTAMLAQTQYDLNQEAGKVYLEADKKLNVTYKEIITKYAKNIIFIENLKKAQRIWIQFRDAQLAMKYPDMPPGYYGSIEPMCESYYLAEITDNRTKQLEEWLKPRTEGNACDGSVGDLDPQPVLGIIKPNGKRAIRIPPEWRKESDGKYIIKDFNATSMYWKNQLDAGHQPWRLESINVAAACLSDFRIVDGPIDEIAKSLQAGTKGTNFIFKEHNKTYTITIKIDKQIPIACELVVQ